LKGFKSVMNEISDIG